MSHPREEIEKTVARYVEVREEIDAGNGTWTDLLQFFTDDDVVVKWTEVIPKPDGTAATQSGYSRLIYAGDGKCRYEEDLLNMVQVLDDIANSGWRPTGPMNNPPKHPNRDVSIPS